MKNLIPIDDDCIEFFYKIVRAKNDPYRKRLARTRPIVKARMETYALQRNSLEVIGTSTYTPVIKNALIHSYEVETQELVRLKNKIKAHQPPYGRSRCQLCTFGSPDTFDHYLEKSQYPEFSSFGINLIPSCPSCNTLKGNVIENGRRNYINLYYDMIPDQQFLFCSVIRVEDGIPLLEYRIDNLNNGISPYLFSIIEEHFTRLSLFDRFKDFVSDDLQQIISDLLLIQNPTRAIVLDVLTEEFEKKRRHFGLNNYLTATLQALTNSDDFLNRF